ncbi:MAG TPA: tetratricopeptide repeat protein [Candidatus Competibacteraceae bacterium]|nr:tetratricopeptide repeat protein [Candidatus Competibacteraceae bacterium]MCP5133742.1 tetratricopeptide repeat protein [Gammaproteobacteria bacterium]HPF58026.1 tetratricopeptide repeat protein [Candidatus Competibacteraceae bacterium]HRY18627.1 tetratricopeptide repeat protein [Candidatus Competibacteraceae bacterium]
MNNACLTFVLLLVMGLVIGPVFAQQDAERNRFFVQQMIDLAAAHNSKGVETMQRMLEQNPQPAALDPAAANASFQWGQAALQQDNLEDALKAFQKTVQDDPGNVDAFNHLGLLYRKLNQFPDAERALQHALSLEPARAGSWFQLAQIYGLQNDQRRALGALANTYRYAQNPMKAEEILRYIAENEAVETLRNAALETLQLYQLPAQPAIVPPLSPNPALFK